MMFFVVDIIGALIEQYDYRGANNYWANLKQKSKETDVSTITSQTLYNQTKL